MSYFTLRWLSKKCKVAKKTMECSGAWSGAPTALRLRARHRRRRCVIVRPSTFRFKDPGSVLKGGVNVCQRQLVNEVLGPLVTEFVPNFGREGATPIGSMPAAKWGVL